MGEKPYRVHVVVDPSYAERIRALPIDEPVWIVDSVGNHPVIRSLWQEHEGLESVGGITSFAFDPAAGPEDWLIAELAVVNCIMASCRMIRPTRSSMRSVCDGPRGFNANSAALDSTGGRQLPKDSPARGMSLAASGKKPPTTALGLGATERRHHPKASPSCLLRRLRFRAGIDLEMFAIPTEAGRDRL